MLMALSQEDREFIQREDMALKMSLENRLTKVVLGQIVSALPVIFFLGGIYFEGKSAVELLKSQKNDVQTMQIWMHEREVATNRLEEWAIEEGYEPGRRSARTFDQIKENYNR